MPQLRPDVADAAPAWRWDQPAMSHTAGPTFSGALQRVRGHLPHAMDHGRAVFATPMVVTGVLFDAGPGLGIDGWF